MKRNYHLQTSIPGPKSRELIERRNRNIPKGPFNTAMSFASSAEGAVITDVDGNRFIDFAGAIGSLNAGHCPPSVTEAVKNQLDRYIHPCFHVMMYEPYVALAEKLNDITPGEHHKKTFFLNSGAEAVENAVKLARKYTGRKAVVSFERGFHGRTYMAMSLTSKVKPYKYEFGPFVGETYKLPFPYYYRKPDGMTDRELDHWCLNRLETFFLSEVSWDETAAVIMEPIQGEGGFVNPGREFVKGVKDICEKYGIVFIADEVQTGFGRTGEMFACDYFGIVPDVMTMSKSIAAGFPISAVTGRAEIMDSAGAGEIGGTYGGSPLGCTAALEVIRLMEESRLPQRARQIGEKVTKRFLEWQDRFEEVGDVRGIGAMTAIELVTDRNSKTPDKPLTQRIIQGCIENGLLIMGAGLYGNVLRILSPLVITDDELEEGLTIMENVMTQHCTYRKKE
ncbi:4-aminobutyrate--2-oxoglutarate transaminase [Alteribacter natronophilus]|uniref:4-aminobutyrate--2-oxoglutarate transaminase n=1 Tax=Alteribacter natronophilus TaxID=2583810 RepID=UPI00110E6190|nr:4-aminobutyrate--2-oxoglutarate transaminase [Alteribacter natronophilus]TMW73513.1 4-aminobutyrate--2-oxoglutarate transaminase [Alteribacter natronophilus]